MATLEISTVKQLEQVEVDAWSDMFAAADESIVAKLGLSQKMFGRAIGTAVTEIDTLGLNRVFGVGSVDTIDENRYRDIEQYYRDAKVGRFFIQAYTDADHELGARLESFGLRHYNNWVKLYRDTSPFTDYKCDLDVRTIGQDEAEHYGRIVVEAFEWHDLPPEWLSATVGRPHWKHYLAYDGDEPAATASMYVKGEVAWIVFAATLEKFRGRGAQAALVAARIRDAAAMGAKLISVETAEQTAEKEAPSYRNMLRTGFKVAYPRPNYLFES